VTTEITLLTAVPTARHSHDTGYFTQGLLRLPSGKTFETTGLYGEARIITRSIERLQTERVFSFADDVFAEDLSDGPSGIVVLTWREKIAIQWSPAAQAITSEFEYDREGWGICYSAPYYLTSDGTSTLVRRDSRMAPVADIRVHLSGRPVAGLNALHRTARGSVIACVYGQDHLVEIDPESGRVVAFIDATSLRRSESAQSEVLSGITSTGSHNGLLLTGKHWRSMYEVEVVDSETSVEDIDAILDRMPAHIGDISDISQPGDWDE
jgi:glutamine cyclotransferase